MRSTLQIDVNDEELLKSYWRSWYPRGSGPLAAMKLIAFLIEVIARDRGYDFDSWELNK